MLPGTWHCNATASACYCRSLLLQEPAMRTMLLSATACACYCLRLLLLAPATACKKCNALALLRRSWSRSQQWEDNYAAWHCNAVGPCNAVAWPCHAPAWHRNAAANKATLLRCEASIAGASNGRTELPTGPTMLQPCLACNRDLLLICVHDPALTIAFDEDHFTQSFHSIMLLDRFTRSFYSIM